MATFQKQVTYASINEKLKRSGLILRGGFTQKDQTTLLIGPNEPSFWDYFRNSPEYKDTLPDPMDRLIFSNIFLFDLSMDKSLTSIIT